MFFTFHDSDYDDVAYNNINLFQVCTILLADAISTDISQVEIGCGLKMVMQHK